MRINNSFNNWGNYNSGNNNRKQLNNESSKLENGNILNGFSIKNNSKSVQLGSSGNKQADGKNGGDNEDKSWSWWMEDTANKMYADGDINYATDKEGMAFAQICRATIRWIIDKLT